MVLEPTAKLITFLLIFFGIGVIWYVRKRPPSHPLTSVAFTGYAFGVGCIICGIIYILDGLHLW